MTARLRLLGAVGLTDSDGREVRAVLAQPKRLALLVYLAAAHPRGFHRRDTLLALFWPDSDEAGARAALSRALHHLRQALGANIITSRGDQELAVDGALLTSDLFDLEEALGRGDAATALTLYQGDVLPGFHVDDAAEFDSWLEGVRQRVRSAVGKGATEAARAAERAGDLAAAVSLARRASELSPYSESALLDLMRLLEARGERSDALVAQQTFVTRFRADLAASPSPELRAAAERIRHGPLAPREPAAARPPPASFPPRVPEGRTIAPRTGRITGSTEPALRLVAQQEVEPAGDEPPPAEPPPADSTPLSPPALFRNRRRAVSLWHGRAPWIIATLTLGALGVLGLLTRRSSAPNISLYDLRQITLAPEPELEPVISPNGADVAYAAGYHPGTRLFVNDLAGGRAVALSADSAGTQGGLRWMPDGRSLTFTEGGATYIVPRFGGQARMLLDKGEVWSIHGDRLAYTRADSLFTRRGTAGAEVLAAARLGPPHSAAWAPDGRRLLFVVGNQRFVRGPDIGNVVRSAIWLVRRDGGTHRVVDDGKMNLSPVWLPDGRGLLFISNRDGPRDIYLLRLNRADSAAGAPVRLTTGLEPHTISLSADGTTVAYSRFTIRKNVWRLALPDRGSVSIREAERVVTGKENAETHDVSADGLWLAFDSDRGGNHDIYIIPLKGGEARRVTADPNNAYCPAFSPDGREIVFMSQRFGAGDLFSIRTDGTGEQRLTDTPGLDWYPSFAPDGRHISYVVLGGAAPGVFILSREAGTERWGRPRQLLATEGDNAFPSRAAVANWSPNGREIAFAISQRIEVVDLEANRRVVLDARSNGLSEAFAPEWSADGRTLYFLGVDGTGQLGIYAVAVAGGSPRPVVLLDQPGLRLFEALTVRGNQLVLTLAEYEADVWTARLKY